MIKLGKVDRKFYKSLPDKEKILLGNSKNFHTILCNKIKAGIIGFIPSKLSKKEGFIQIVLSEKFRRKGIAKKAEELLVKKHKLRKLYATIASSNLISIKAHKKFGFKPVSQNVVKKLRKKGLLKEDSIRLVKKFKLS